MGPTGKWIPGNAPPDEAYWQALLNSGERHVSGPAVEGAGPAPDAPAFSADVVDVEQWADALQAMQNGEALEASVIGHNRGGVIVGWNGLRGFVPISQLSSLSGSLGDEERYRELRRLVGKRLTLEVVEIDPAQRRFVLSEHTGAFDRGQQRVTLDEIIPGDIRQGRVTNLCSFGAFVDLGGLEGLLHISELSWGRVGHPRDVLEPGQSVEVYVINVDRERERVGLSLRRLQPDPWQFVQDRYQVGQVIDGVVTHIVDFGAFARVDEGLEGLIHVSELAEGDVSHPRDVVMEGEAVKALIINIDGEKRRMGLSLRQLDNPYTAG